MLRIVDMDKIRPNGERDFKCNSDLDLFAPMGEYKWWETEWATLGQKQCAHASNGNKWTTLSHNGPLLAEDYNPVPDNVTFKYDGEPTQLLPRTEEVAVIYARLMNEKLSAKLSSMGMLATFNDNFFADWKHIMSKNESDYIVELSKCDFSQLKEYVIQNSGANKAKNIADKLRDRKARAIITETYGYAVVDGYRQKIGNFNIEPPGLFMGRGKHPRLGRIKHRIQAEDITINIGANSPIPNSPPGHHWKDVQHDKRVSWLAMWRDSVTNHPKYVMLNPASALKSKSDYYKYEKARSLHRCIDRIRKAYMLDLKSVDKKVCQLATSTYVIDHLALRAGCEKDTDELADTVGCCTLRTDHVTLEQLCTGDNVKFLAHFRFDGKDSIKYEKSLAVDAQVFCNLQMFGNNENKTKTRQRYIFDLINASDLNDYLNKFMVGLTAKVFRTYNASITLEEQLAHVSHANGFQTSAEKMSAYNWANRSAAILCNHRRAVPKKFEKTINNLRRKINNERNKLAALTDKTDILTRDKSPTSLSSVMSITKEQHRLDNYRERIKRKRAKVDDEESNLTIALDTSKLNYLDPRISISWCKKQAVDISFVFSETQREKFRWAEDMVKNEEKEFLF